MKPVPDADTEPYWAGIAAGELRLQRCAACGLAVFYPRAVCPHCFGAPLTWFTARGTGQVYSYTVVHRPSASSRIRPRSPSRWSSWTRACGC